MPPAKLAERGDAEHRLLHVIGARVAMALPDLSTERAEAVHALNDAGMPVVAIPMGAPALCHADAIAVGSTGGGDPGDGPEVPVVGWEELSRDLLVARRCTTDITIHSLEGCTAHELPARLESFDWASSRRSATGRPVHGGF